MSQAKKRPARRKHNAAEDDAPELDGTLEHRDAAAADEHEAEDGTSLVLPHQNLPERLLLLPILDRPFFPAQVQPLVIDEAPWSETFDRLEKMEQPLLGLVYAGDQDSSADVGDEDFHDYGCVVRLHNTVRSNGKIQFIAQGLQRFRRELWLHRKAPFAAEVSYPNNGNANMREIKAYAMALIQALKELIPLNPLYNEELKNFLNNFNLNDPSPLADFAAAITTAPGEELQDVLATPELQERMQKVLVILQREIDVARLQSEIRGEVEQKMSNHQREFFLREELKIIQRELGIAKDDRTAEADEFRERMAAKKPDERVVKRFQDELAKLQILEPGSPEYGVTRNYLDWMSSVPWGVYSEDHLDLELARKVLDRDHAALSDVKDHIVEFLASGVFRGGIAGSILLLVGPPGVGKTSIGKSIAEALGRKFYRFSLGGMRDEAEIKGHRRTYIGAMPGKLVQALKDVEVANPVIMLDEIDKLGSSFQGDPGSALLEVLDPEQNGEFLDHYLDLRVDLSKVLFICTANQLDTIPRPLLDRMDMIRLSGYLTEEKLEIATRYLWPKLLKRDKVKRRQVKISRRAMKALIEGHAREAGVRNLEKLLHKILRKSIVRLLDGESSVSIDTDNLSDFVGEPSFRVDRRLSGVGVVTGLAWTAMGGATLPIEASRVHQKQRSLELTGQLGKVMNESARIAHSYVTAEAERFGVSDNWFNESALHLHVPEGATPKDGPSAGVTITSALLSLALDKPVRKNLAMTGELTLTGEVLPVGGIREKLVAAKRAGISEVILPGANEPDVDELPEHIPAGLLIHFADRYSDVFELLFSKTAPKAMDSKRRTASKKRVGRVTKKRAGRTTKKRAGRTTK